MGKNISFEWDEKAFKNTVQDAFEEHLATEGVEYDCPNCEAVVVIKTGKNYCHNCGQEIIATAEKLQL